MNAEVEQVMELLDRLDAPAKAEIAYRLLTSLGPEEALEDPDAFEAELERRVEDIRSGRVVGRPLEEVLAELDALDDAQA